MFSRCISSLDAPGRARAGQGMTKSGIGWKFFSRFGSVTCSNVASSYASVSRSSRIEGGGSVVCCLLAGTERSERSAASFRAARQSLRKRQHFTVICGLRRLKPESIARECIFIQEANQSRLWHNPSSQGGGCARNFSGAWSAKRWT